MLHITTYDYYLFLSIFAIIEILIKYEYLGILFFCFTFTNESNNYLTIYSTTNYVPIAQNFPDEIHYF